MSFFQQDERLPLPGLYYSEIGSCQKPMLEELQQSNNGQRVRDKTLQNGLAAACFSLRPWRAFTNSGSVPRGRVLGDIYIYIYIYIYCRQGQFQIRTKFLPLLFQMTCKQRCLEPASNCYNSTMPSLSCTCYPESCHTYRHTLYHHMQTKRPHFKPRTTPRWTKNGRGLIAPKKQHAYPDHSTTFKYTLHTTKEGP